MSNWDQIRGAIRAESPADIEAWHRIVDEGRRQESEWIARLRAEGFKAAHPNDGWVDRKNKRFRLVYPQFNDGVVVGARVMLGWAFDRPERLRPVVVTGVESSALAGERYTFSDLAELERRDD